MRPTHADRERIRTAINDLLDERNADADPEYLRGMVGELRGIADGLDQTAWELDEGAGAGTPAPGRSHAPKRTMTLTDSYATPKRRSLLARAGWWLATVVAALFVLAGVGGLLQVLRGEDVVGGLFGVAIGLAAVSVIRDTYRRARDRA